MQCGRDHKDRVSCKVKENGDNQCIDKIHICDCLMTMMCSSYNNNDSNIDMYTYIVICTCVKKIYICIV